MPGSLSESTGGSVLESAEATFTLKSPTYSTNAVFAQADRPGRAEGPIAYAQAGGISDAYLQPSLAL